MKILILGGNGMIGHKIYQELKDEFDDTWVLIRKKLSVLKYKDIYDSKVIDEFDLTNVELLISKLNFYQPLHPVSFTSFSFLKLLSLF